MPDDKPQKPQASPATPPPATQPQGAQDGWPRPAADAPLPSEIPPRIVNKSGRRPASD